MGSKDFEKLCLEIVRDYTNEHFDKTDSIRYHRG